MKITNILIFGILAAAIIVGLYYYLTAGRNYNGNGDDNNEND